MHDRNSKYILRFDDDGQNCDLLCAVLAAAGERTATSTFDAASTWLCGIGDIDVYFNA